MNETNYYDFMTIGELKEIIKDLDDEMLMVIPVVDEEDVNHIYGFRKVRTAGILHCEAEEHSEVLCLNGATGEKDIADQVYFSGRDVDVVDVLYGVQGRSDIYEQDCKRD